MTTHPNAQEDKRRAALGLFNDFHYNNEWFDEQTANTIRAALTPAVEPVVDKDLVAAIAYAEEYIIDSRANYLAPHHVQILIKAAKNKTPPETKSEE